MRIGVYAASIVNGADRQWAITVCARDDIAKVITYVHMLTHMRIHTKVCTYV